MSALTSLLVRDRVVPVSKIEEALQSQVFLGGDIEILLLEMNLLPEDVLSAYRAALFDLLPATREEVMKASREALRRVPRELARALGVVPMQYEAGVLIVAAWEPLPAARVREVEAQLGCSLSVRIVNQARLAAGLSHHYAFELDPRLRRLSDSLRRREPGVVPFVRPPNPSLRPVTTVQNAQAAHESNDGEDEVGAQSQAASVLEEAYIDVEAAVTAAIASASQGASPDETSGVTESEPEEGQPVLPEEEDERLPPGVSPALAQLVAGPVSLARAHELLQHARQRDDVLYVLLRYLQHHFDLVCVFGIGKEGARARMAHGAGIDRARVQDTVIAAPREGLIGRAVAARTPVLGSLDEASEDQPVTALLRGTATRRGLAVPIALKDRVVLVVFLARVREGIAIADASVVEALVPAVVPALRRIILESKAQRRAESSRPPPPLGPPEVSVPEVAAEPAVEPEVVADAAADSAELSAVDLDTFERLARNEVGWEEIAPPRAKLAPNPSEAPSRRERLPGVPRAAPAPPAYEELPKAAPTANGYRLRVANPVAPPQVIDVVAEPGGPAEPSPQVNAAADDAAPGDARGGRSRLSLVEPSVDVPSVIIDMGESVESLIELLLDAPPGQEPPQVAELLHIGESVLPVLVQRFPGPLWFDRTRPFKRRPRGRDVSAVAYAIVAFGDPAAPYLASMLGASDPDRCYYALMVAGELAHGDLVDPVARRVLDRDDSLRLLALEVLRGYSSLPQYEVVMRAIAELTERPGKDSRRQRLAVEALGELRDPRALRALLPRLSDRDEQVAQAAHRALVVLTGQDFGLAPRKWQSWAEGWGRAHRVEWLIESLLHNDEGVRALAGEELKQLTQQYFGYHPGLPRRDRELSQRKYREWWELEGRLAMVAAVR